MPGYLPPHLGAGDVAAVLGLISDTHIPQRWPDVPTNLADIFEGFVARHLTCGTLLLGRRAAKIDP